MAMENRFFIEKRKRALATFLQMDFPTHKDEEWKYTGVKSFVEKKFTTSAPQLLSKVTINNALFSSLAGYVIAFINGRYSEKLSVLPQGKGITVAELSIAYQKHQTIIDKHWGTLCNGNENAFTTMNLASANKGVFVYVEKNRSIDQPIYIVHITTNNSGNLLIQPRNLILVAAQAKCAIVEHSIHMGNGNVLENGVTEIFAEKYASIDHYKLQLLNKRCWQVNTCSVRQASSSTYNNTTLTFGGGLVRNNLRILLNGIHCAAYMNGLLMLFEKISC